MLVCNTNVLSVYKEIAELDDTHRVMLVQHIVSKKIYVKKVLEIYSKSVYEYMIDHPVSNMPRILETVESDDVLTIIEDYIPGDTLRYTLDNSGPLCEDDVLSISLQLCRILQELHNAVPPIVHRDIKPENIILTQDGIVKLLDMNAARQFSPDNTNDTRILGTVGFAAPEQYGFTQSSVQTDIYAVGVLMNMLLTGQLPNKVLSNSAFRPIISRCTEISPKDRYATISDLILQLELLSSNNAAATSPQPQDAGYNWRHYLPPGFRSLRIPTCIFASLCYALIYGLFLSAKVKNAAPKTLLINRLVLVLLATAVILFSGNYLEVQKQFPLTRSNNKIVCLIGIIIYDIGMVFSTLFMLIIAAS